MSVQVKLRIEELEAALAAATEPKKRARLQRELAAAKRTDRALVGAPTDDDDDEPPATAPDAAEDAKHKALLRDPFLGDKAALDRAADAVIERAMRAPGVATVSMGPGRTPLTIELGARVAPADRAAIRRQVDALPRGSR